MNTGQKLPVQHLHILQLLQEKVITKKITALKIFQTLKFLFKIQAFLLLYSSHIKNKYLTQQLVNYMYKNYSRLKY